MLAKKGGDNVRGRRMTRQFGLVVLMALAVAGCGRRGALEPPPGSAAAASAVEPSVSANGSDMALMPGKSRKPKPVQPGSDPFFLDPLL